MTESSAPLGNNRTGMETASSDLNQEMVEGARQGTPQASMDLGAQKSLRNAYLEQHEKVGSIPPPGNLKGMAQTGLQALKGGKAHVLIDKLGERLAFERTGTRLYEAVISKAEADGQSGAGPNLVQDLRRFQKEELAHFHMLKQHIERLGADPTAVTPAADVAGVASSGILSVAADPRTTVGQTLEALLVAELTDNDGWSMLIDLAKDMGQDDMANQFQKALEEEDRHLASVRQWVTENKRHEASVLG